MANQPPKQYLSLELAYTETKELLKIQLQLIAEIDTKASVLLGFAGVILAALFSNLVGGTLPPGILDQFLLGSAVVCTVASLTCSFLSYRAREHRLIPDPRRLSEKYLDRDPAYTKLKLFDTLIIACEGNQSMIRSKARFLTAGFWLLFVGILLLGIALLLPVTLSLLDSLCYTLIKIG